MKALPRILAMTALLAPWGCRSEPSAAPATMPIVVTEVHWSSANPSLGPSEHTSGVNVLPGNFESPAAWDAAITTLLDETRVNGVATLREYLVARRDRDAARTATIEAEDQRDLEPGGGYASLDFVLDPGGAIDIANLKRTRLTGEWDHFWASHIRSSIDSSSSTLLPGDAPLAPSPEP